MITTFIGCLIAVAAYLGKRLSDSHSENVALRGQIAALKRQLVRRRAAS
jgi:hypothetical protein